MISHSRRWEMKLVVRWCISVCTTTNVLLLLWLMIIVNKNVNCKEFERGGWGGAFKLDNEF